MTTTTTNLKLNVPVFDQQPWDEDVNDNWIILDAVVGQFSTLPNMVGVWKNSTAYVYGQTTVDSHDGSIWSCTQTNTSSAAPITFAQERVSFPARWGAVGPGGQYWAQQAANSAAAAAESAAEAAASAATINAALPIAGGTMTGTLTLHADPTANLQAATKQYVDARVGGTGYLPTTGGTLTGALEVGGNGTSYTIMGSYKHAMAFGWNNSAVAIYVDGTGIGYVATQAYVSGAYLPLGGGNVSGLINSTDQFWGVAFKLTTSGAVWQSDGSYTHLFWDSANWQLRFTRSGGRLEYLNAAGAALFSVDGSGTASVANALVTANDVLVGGSVRARGDHVYVGPHDDASFNSDGSTHTSLGFLGNYAWLFDWSTGGLVWTRYDGSVGFQIRVSDGQAGCDTGPVYGNGGYNNISDESVKQNITPAGEGLEHVLALEPIMFERIIRPGEIEVGFSAQQVQHVLPHAVRQSGEVLAITLDPIVVALVNGMKELNTRMLAQEAKSGTTTH